MAEEYVTLQVGGMAWSAWTRVGCQYSAKQAVRSFAVTVTDSSEPWGAQWNFMPGTEVSVMANNDLVLKGFINRMTPSYDATNHKVEIAGRSKSQDTVDSSAEHETSEFKDKTILQIAQELDKQGVGFSSAAKELKKIEKFRLNPGETVFAAIERLARKQQLLLIGKPDGSIEIAEGGDKRVHAPLIEGENILGASAVFDDSDKNSEVKVKGQRPFGGRGKDSLQVEGSAKDKSVKRNRPKVILSETDGSQEDAKKRAEAQRDRQSGESISASVKVQGWRCSNGILWQPNTLIYVYSPMLKLSMDMLIESVSLSQDSSGSFSQLSLVHPKALGSKAKPGGKVKTGGKTEDVWNDVMGY